MRASLRRKYSALILHVHFSTWSVVKQIIRQEGTLGLFRGLTSTWAREVPGYFFFFGGYDASRKLLTPAGGSYDDLSEQGV